MKLLQPGVNKEPLIKVVKEGVYCERLNDVNSKDFKEAYAMLRRYFPSDELDPATDLVEMQSQNDRNFAKLCSKDSQKSRLTSQLPSISGITSSWQRTRMAR